VPSKCGSGPAGIVCKVASIPGNTVKHAVASGTSSMLHDVAEAMASAAGGLLKTMTSMWMQVDTPQLAGASSPATTIMSGIQWITASVAVACILVAGARIAVRRRGEPGSAMVLGLARLVIVSALATFLVQLAGQAGDELSASLVHAAYTGAGGWSSVISVTGVSAALATGDGTLLTVSVVIVVATLIQLLMMVMRVGLLIILTGTLPLAAAASMSDWGENWWRKHLGWLAAWLAYKPAAAVLFASATVLTHGRRSFVEVAAGFMILVLMVFLLPALLRLIAPVTSALGAASGGALALGAAGAVATGASRIGGIDGIRSMLSGQGGDGPSGDTGSAASGSGTAPEGLTPGSADAPDGAGSAESGTAGSETSFAERLSGDSPGSEGSGSREDDAHGLMAGLGFPEGTGGGVAGPGGAASGNGMPGSDGADDTSEAPASGVFPEDTGPFEAGTAPPGQDGDSSPGPPGASGDADDEPHENGG